MSAMDDAAKSSSAWLLRCHVCDRLLDVTAQDISQFSKLGWPSCCDCPLKIYKQIALPKAISSNDT